MDNQESPQLEAAQTFVSSWMNNQQIFHQKTSGSTGKPKILKIHRNQFVSSAKRTAKALQLRQGLRALLCIDLRYIGGKMMIARGLELGWHMHITPASTQPYEWLSEKLKFDFAAMVPLQIEHLLASKEGLTLLNSIDKIIVGGAPVNTNIVAQLQQLSCKVYATYGMTETVSHVALQSLNGPGQSDFFSMLPGIEHDLDERGCLKVKADVTNHEWIQTNDIVTFQSASEFKVLGRADNVINTGGVKVQIELLEKEISATGLLTNTNFAISHRVHQSLGQEVVLVIEQRAPLDPNILERLKPLLPAYHSPKVIVQLDQLPKTPAGKLDRVTLNTLAEQNR